MGNTIHPRLIDLISGGWSCHQNLNISNLNLLDLTWNLHPSVTFRTLIFFLLVHSPTSSGQSTSISSFPNLIAINFDICSYCLAIFFSIIYTLRWISPMLNLDYNIYCDFVSLYMYNVCYNLNSTLTHQHWTLALL